MSQETTQLVRIAKDFHWEMGHRLPFHNGGCRNIHGHSYRMRVTIEGELDEYGMVMDYFDMKQVIDPLVESLDHAFLCDEDDKAMIAFLTEHSMKHLVVPFYTTAENLAQWFLNAISILLRGATNIHTLTVRIHETERTYAERQMIFEVQE